MKITDLQDKKLSDLKDLAKNLGLSGYSHLRKQDLIYRILVLWTGTRAFQILVGLVLLVAVYAVAQLLELGLITAIYLSEYAPRKVRSVLKPVLEILAGIPTVR